jgi:hypothetical protein
MAQFVAGKESERQVWGGDVIRNCICIGRSGYPPGRLFLCGRAINPRKAREADAIVRQISEHRKELII